MFINCMSIALPVRTENRAVGKTSNPNPNPQLCGVLDVWLHLLPHGELWCFLYIDYFIYLYIFCGWRICPQLRHLSTSLSYLMTSEIVIPWTCVQMYWWDWVRPLCDMVYVWILPVLDDFTVFERRFLITSSIYQWDKGTLRAYGVFFFQIYNRLNLHGAEASGGVLWNTQERRGLIQD